MVERWRPVSGGTAVVSASDYDALAAELAGQRDENAHLCSELHRNQDRVRVLEAALRSHKDFHCTCGFAVDHVLTPPETKGDAGV